MDPTKTDRPGEENELDPFSSQMHALLDECMIIEEANLVRVVARATYSIDQIYKVLIQGKHYLGQDDAALADVLNSPEHREDLTAMVPEICLQIRKGNLATQDLGITKIEEIFDESGRITIKGVQAIEALAMRALMKRRGGSNREVG